MEKGYGGALSMPIWAKFMQRAPEKQYPARAFESPTMLRKVKLCATSNNLAAPGCDLAETSYEAELPVSRIPGDVCTAHPVRAAPVFASQIAEPVGTGGFAGAGTAPQPPIEGQSTQPQIETMRVPPTTGSRVTERLAGGGTAIIERGEKGVTITRVSPAAPLPATRAVPNLGEENVPVRRAEVAGSPAEVRAGESNERSRDVPVLRAEPVATARDSRSRGVLQPSPRTLEEEPRRIEEEPPPAEQQGRVIVRRARPVDPTPEP